MSNEVKSLCCCVGFNQGCEKKEMNEKAAAREGFNRKRMEAKCYKNGIKIEEIHQKHADRKRIKNKRKKNMNN